MPFKHAFGIGCFHFGYHKPIPFEFSTTQYVKDVRNALSELTAISHIDIQYDKLLAQDITVEEELPNLENGDYFPFVHFLGIRFSVYIPRRIQEEIFPGENLSDWIQAENFSVLIKHEYHGPITFIECLDATDESNPSAAVRLLREYLKREFNKLKGPVSFEYLGPSPFHANFFVQKAEDVEGIRIEEITQRGYHDFVFHYGEAEETKDILTNVYEHLRDEVDTFYEIQRRAVRFMGKSDSLVDSWRKLSALVSEPGHVFNIFNKFRIYKGASKFINDLYEFQAEHVVEEKGVNQIINGAYKKGMEKNLEKYIRQKIEKFPSFPTDPLLNWAARIETNFFKQVDIVAVTISGILGGTIGTLLTVWLGKS